MLTRRDVGHRVAIRRIVADRDGGPRHAEVVGVLDELAENDLLISARAGRIRVPLAAVLAARRVPDRRALTATERLELVAAAGWPAPETGRIGEWLLRAAGGWTARANSALPVGQPGVPLSEAVDAVVGWYRDHGLSPAIAVPEPVGGRLTTVLVERGWTADPPSIVMTAPLATIAVARDTHPAEIRLDAAPSAGWFAAVAAYKGGTPAVAQKVIMGVPLARFAGCYDRDGAALAVGRGVVVGTGRPPWLGLSLVTVDRAFRRQGLATAIVAALARWALGEGARQTYLQVEERDTSAIQLYERLGFTVHHRYTTWRTPLVAPAP